ncbi:MAG: pirin family protein [Rhodospirillales bacterium]|nr:pirin family protein [Rhodospirillales bacterium]
MIERRPFDRLGRFRNDWLNARHHFNFGGYRDPARNGFGRVLVWNDDEIAPGTGFDPHPHREMEIITYVRDGAITHEDSLGHRGRTEAGDVQVMHAGTGIVHAEYNRETVPTRLFQIWIRPDRAGVAPGWATRAFPRGEGLRVLASGRPGAPEDALALHADAAVIAGTLAAGQETTLELDPARAAYLVVASGEVTVNGVNAGTRDGLAIAGERTLHLTALAPSEIVMVDTKAG